MSLMRFLPYAAAILVANLLFAQHHQFGKHRVSIMPAKPRLSSASRRELSGKQPRHITANDPPAPIYGPPLPPEQAFDREQARQLLDHLHAGRLRLTIPEREEEQLRTLALAGRFFWPAPPPDTKLLDEAQQSLLADTGLPALAARETSNRREDLASRAASHGHRQQTPNIVSEPPTFDPLSHPPAPALMRMLVALAARSTPDRPLELMSLLRPPYRTGGFIHVGLLNPHSLGLAADIASYGGYTIRQDQPESCVAAAVALMRTLPAGRYRLGMPKAPETPLFVDRPPLPASLTGWLPTPTYRTDSSQNCPPDVITAALTCVMLGEPKPQPWPFFPAPLPELKQGRIAPRVDTDNPVSSPERRRLPAIARYRNESYAPIEELQDARLRDEIAAASRRGVEIIAAFPDGADHIHIDVRQYP